jgi:Ca2+/Na+ antiporter
MANGEIIAYNVAAFVCALFVLEKGADVFIDHTVIVAKRTGIPQPIIALLTAGAEWEEVGRIDYNQLTSSLW